MDERSSNEPVIDPEEILEGIQEWVEIETPRHLGEEVNKLVDVVEKSVQALGAVVGAAAFAFAAAPHAAPVAGADMARAEALAVELGEPPAGGSLLELPAAATARDIVGDRRNARYMLASTRHWWPLLGKRCRGWASELPRGLHSLWESHVQRL